MNEGECIMKRFKRLTTVEPDTWNPDSPVEWIKGAILFDNSTGKILLQLKLCNISNEHIKSVHLLIDGFDEMGESLCTEFQFFYQDLKQVPHTTFGEQNPIYLPDKRIRKVHIHFNKVMFADGTIAAIEDKNMPIPDRESITDWPDNLVNELNRVYEDYNDSFPLIYIPKELDDNWLCSCGKMNTNNQGHCVRCGRDRSTQLRIINKDFLLESLQKYHKQLETQKIEAESKLEEARKLRQQRNEKFRKKLRKFAVFAVLLIVVGISIFSVHSIIQQKQAEEAHNELLQKEENTYKTALSLYNSTDNRKSIPLFRKIGNYKDSSKYAQLAQNRLQNLLAAGTFHTVGIKSDGTLLSAGNTDDCGQYNVKGWKNIISVITDNGYTAGLKNDGTVCFAGNNSFKYYSKDTGLENIKAWANIKEIANGECFIVGLKTDGSVISTINDKSIQEMNQSADPFWSQYLSDIKNSISAWTNISQISAQFYRAVGLKKDGTVLAAGDNIYGGCDISSWKNIISIATTNNYTFGLKTDGTVIKAGNYVSIPINVSNWKGIVAISSSDSHIVGLESDGSVIAVGDNKQNECDVSNWRDIIAVKAGYGYTIGLKSDGSVISTSSGDNGIYTTTMNWNLFK